MLIQVFQIKEVKETQESEAFLSESVEDSAVAGGNVLIYYFKKHMRVKHAPHSCLILAPFPQEMMPIMKQFCQSNAGTHTQTVDTVHTVCTAYIQNTQCWHTHTHTLCLSHACK